ncbi:MAG: LamG-like jellyroll fold domain-containing protein [Planctomycetota bacterium]|jgi:hypothetical protein
MSKKLFVLMSFVLVVGFVSIVSAQPTRSERKCWWSDWGATHDWNEPNNWYTMDHFFIDDDNDGARDYGETMWFVKVEPNQLPDYNISAIIGKGGAREVYPRALHDYVEGAGPMTDPTISAGMVIEANTVQLGGGESFDPNVGGGALDPDANHDDPNRSHYLWMTGGTLTVGAPQTWEGYEVEYGYGEFNGQWASGRFCIAVVPAPGYGSFYMSGGTVNVGGHLEAGAWGGTALLDMTGGTINAVQGVYAPSDIWGGSTSTINLHGGEINARLYHVASGVSSLDVTEGKMTLKGDRTDVLNNYAGGGQAGASITTYGVGHSEVVTDPCYGGALGKRAALSIDYDVGTSARTTLSASVTDLEQAWAPSPPNEASGAKGPSSDLLRPILSWSAGDNATSHHVYFGTSHTEVDDANTSSGEYKGPQVLADVNYTVATDLDILTQYFWRIDEVNAAPVKGQVWNFTVANVGKASYPYPADEADEVTAALTLHWTPGVFAVMHNVYFGTSFDEVNDANTTSAAFMVNQGPNTYETTNYDPNALELGKRYYWRIDEVNGVTIYPGDVWSFTTDDHLTVEDFDSYETLEPDLYAVWDDYSYPGNEDSGAEIGLQTTEPFVRSGHSLLYTYDNSFKTGGQYLGSWIDADIVDLPIGSDWTLSGSAALVLYFFGTLDNSAGPANKMWVELEDTSSNSGVSIYDGEPGDVNEPKWQEWNVDLAAFDACGVSLTDVDRIHIGFGGPRGEQGKAAGGTGTVYFDDIEIWPVRCVPAHSYPSGDLTGNCLTNLYDVEAMADDWLVGDFNTIGFDGTLKNYDDPNSAWTTDAHDGNALQIVPTPGDANELATYCATSGQELPNVEIPPLYLNTNAVTFTAWVKRDGDQCDWMEGIVFQRDGDTTAGLCFGNKEVTKNDLAFNWDDLASSWGWDSGLTTPNLQWFFAALVISPDLATIYLYDGSLSSNSPKAPAQGYPPEPFEGITYIGQDVHNQARNVIGWIDDVRIYDYSLTQSQILGVATTGEPNDPYIWYKLDDGSGIVATDTGTGGIVYHPNPSPANYHDDEPAYQRYVNFKDFDYLARNWLKEVLFP